MAINQVAALVFGIGAGAFFVAWALHNRRVYREVARWNSATTPEEIQALLPPGDRYDAETGLCYPSEQGALPYRRGMLRAE